MVRLAWAVLSLEPYLTARDTKLCGDDEDRIKLSQHQTICP